MNSLNRAQIIGNITRDPELRQTPSGQAVCTLGVATNRSWTNRETGEKQEQVEFHNVVCWGKLAEICGQYLAKGRKVFFEGRLQTRNWEDADSGKKMYRTEIIADNMIMLGSRGEENTSAGSPAPAQAEEKAPAPSEEEEIKVEDLPF